MIQNSTQMNIEERSRQWSFILNFSSSSSEIDFPMWFKECKFYIGLLKVAVPAPESIC